jgi:hypothetical protein
MKEWGGGPGMAHCILLVASKTFPGRRRAAGEHRLPLFLDERARLAAGSIPYSLL